MTDLTKIVITKRLCEINAEIERYEKVFNECNICECIEYPLLKNYYSLQKRKRNLERALENGKFNDI